MNKTTFSILFFLFALLGTLIFREQVLTFIGNSFFALTAEPSRETVFSPLKTNTQDENADSSDESAQTTEVVAENLAIPWALAFLPDGSLLVTERPGRVVRLMQEARESIPVAGVEHVGEGGLLGLALHPEYESNNWLYLYHTTRTSSGLINRVERYRFNEKDNLLEDRQIILDNIPASTNHDGGRLAFGPDNLLYITTGDAGNQNAAQDTQSLAGKILRVRDDGSVPSDNPFGNEVYSYGHRNPQGLAWDSNGQLWSTEHGPSGISSGYDELNLIQSGSNYGWPVIRGDETRDGMVRPVIHSGSDETWAPADLAIVDESVLFSGLRGQALYTAQITGQSTSARVPQLQNQFGRLRLVILSPDGNWVYISTSNTDGRGRKQAGDDKLIRVKVSSLK